MREQITPAEEQEEWRPVLDYEGWYEVSDQGRVRRVAKSWPGIEVPYILKGQTSNVGYCMVFLYRHSKFKNVTVHSLVLQSFVGPRPAGHDADHINHIRTDNRLSNLRWLNSFDNSSHPGETHGFAKLTDEDIRIIRSTELKKYGDRKRLAERFKVHATHIDRIRLNKARIN